MINRELISDLPRFRRTEAGYFIDTLGRERKASQWADPKWIGSQFGMLTVLEARRENSRTYWRCACACGTTKLLLPQEMVGGIRISCGCARPKILHKLGAPVSGMRLHRIWAGAKKRCYTPTDKEYARYGARGIRICEEWKADFRAFYEWANANGYRDGLTLDRKDNNLWYSPGNCRWATPQEQANNRSNNRRFLFDGQLLNIGEAAEKFQITFQTLYWRIKRAGIPNGAEVPPFILRPASKLSGGRW